MSELIKFELILWVATILFGSNIWKGMVNDSRLECAKNIWEIFWWKNKKNWKFI
jgi:hypothetical protein